jgi:hypothetical protein
MPITPFETVPQNATEKDQFDFAHQDHHNQIAQFFQTSGTTLDVFVLDPLQVESGSAILQHQAMHDQLDALLGTPNYDMTVLNWADTASKAQWVGNNYQAHLNYANLLGIE